MTALTESVKNLAARLPSLAWKLNSLFTLIPVHLLPRGLFARQLELTPQSCMDEIKTDLAALSSQKNERSAHYQAARISRKINVLVRLCQVQGDKLKPSPAFGVQAISTRQQWLAGLEEDVAKLTLQREALIMILHERQAQADAQATINLQAEIGAIEQRLTLANEMLARATTY